LAENGLKLKSLDFLVNILGEEENSFEFLPLLAKLFKNSIQRLVVDEVSPSLTQLPHMPKLETLELDVPNGFDSKCVNLNKLCPSLKELELYYRDRYEDADGDDEWEELLPNSDPCPNLKSLSLGQIVITIQLFDHILNIFPKLSKLVCDVGSDGEEILRKIMTRMTQLEDLSVYGEIEGIENIDALLTGIPVQHVQELQHVITGLKEMTVQLRSEVIRQYTTQYSQLPSIANLTNLKHLQLSTTGTRMSDEEEIVTTMTDVFAYFGLYSMKHIKKLKIQNCEFTKTGAEILTAEMGLETWSFKNEDADIIPPVE